MKARQQGFTIVEIIIATAVFALSILTVIGLATALQRSQQNNQYLSLASIAAKNILEEARNSQISELRYGTTIPKSATQVPELKSLPNSSATLTTSYVEGTYGIKNLTATVTYYVGASQKTVSISSFGGDQVISQ